MDLPIINDETYPLRAVIDLDALEYNCKVIQSLSPNAKIIAVVKANAYGFGLEVIAHSLQDLVEGVGVSRVHEGISLRKSGFKKSILQLQGFFDLNTLLACIKYDITMVIHSIDQMSILEKALPYIKDKKINFWLKIETGMHRLGLEANQVLPIYNQLMNMGITDKVVLCTHMSSAGSKFDFMAVQLQEFEQIKKQLPELPISISASQSLFYHNHIKNDYLRIGIGMYGIHAEPCSVLIKPVMSLLATLVSVKKIPARSYVGYENTWQAKSDTIIGIVSIGYGDGYSFLRDESSYNTMYLNGRLVPIIGRISMDMTAVDLGPVATDSIGDQVEIFGENLKIENFAPGYVSRYLITSQITERVKRIYKNVKPELRDFVKSRALIID